MRRSIQLATLVCCFASPVHAVVDLSFVGVGSLASASVTAAAPYPSGIGFNTTPGLAFGVGGLMGVDLVRSFVSLEFGALYVPRESTLVASGISLASSLSAAETMKTVQLPVLLRLNFLKFLSLGAGAYYWWGRGNVTSTTGGTTTSGSYTDAGYVPHDYGFVASVSITIPLVPRVAIRADGRYLMGTSNLSATPGITTLTRDLQLLAGLQITI